MSTWTFDPHVDTVGRFPGLATIEQLAEETGVYSATPDFVRAHCGPIANSILDQIPERFYAMANTLGLYPNIDVRIHRLYYGDYPAVPGWHADGEFREHYHAQPDMTRIPNHLHLAGTVSTDPDGVSMTEFVTWPTTVTVDGASERNTFWSQVHTQVEASRVQGTTLAPDGELTEFSSWTLHRCTPARTRGWRLFLRASMWHKPHLNGEGIVSRQEQVYRVREGAGW